MQPAGTDVLSRSNAYSRIPTLTVVVGVLHAAPPPPPPVVVPPVVPVVVVTVVVATFTPTLNVPFMPAVACPGIVQRKPYFFFDLNTTLSERVLPGAIVSVFLPLILKSCGSLPLFVTLKITVAGFDNDFRDSTNLNSVAVTRIVTVAAEAEELDGEWI